MHLRKKVFNVFLFFFGLTKKKDDVHDNGTILILIDGLSYSALSAAIQKKYCPTLKKLLKLGYQCHPYDCGLPAATSATEAELFYGNHTNIPGFTWFDRTLGRFVRGNRSEELAQFEDTYPKRRNLMQGGSVIMSVYTGGATELSMSGRNASYNHSGVMIKTLHYILMSILYPTHLLRALYMTIKVVLLYARSERNTGKEILSKLFLGQFSCFLTEIEIQRGVQNIFVDFLIYDEFAHEYGPMHPTTFATLRLIDKYIKRIQSTAKHSGKHYDIIILSDHGQTKSIPYDIQKEQSTLDITHALQDPTRTVIKTYGGFIPNSQKKELYVVPAGSTLQLYFSDHLDKALSYEEIEHMYPSIIKNLQRITAFGWLLMRKKDGGYELVGGKPPNIFTPRLMKILASYSHYPNNGDIVIFGAIDEKKNVFSFEKHRGTHGGLYGDMRKPFVLTKNKDIIRKLESKDATMESIFDQIEYNMR